MRIIKTIVLLSIVFLLVGCVSSTFYDVDVDSISTSIAKQKNKYILLPGNKDCKITDLQFQEFATYSEKVLQSRGFTKASNIDEAEIAIILSYGISDPKCYKYTYSVPVWGQTGSVFFKGFRDSQYL